MWFPIAQRMSFLLFILIISFRISVCFHHKGRLSRLVVKHQWVTLDYDWPSPEIRQQSIENGNFIPEHNIPFNIDVNKRNIFVSVQRARNGVPSTLNRVIRRKGVSLLQPFPSFEAQTIGDCTRLQSVISMEVDPLKNQLWAIDQGMVNRTALCHPKIVLFDIRTKSKVDQFVIPESVASGNGLNDISLDVVNGRMRYAYITQTRENKLIVLDVLKRKFWFFSHPSMNPEPNAANITVGEDTIMSMGGINGIATTSDFRFVYFISVAGFNVWQIPTFVLRNPKGQFDANVRSIGTKPFQSVGMTSGFSPRSPILPCFHGTAKKIYESLGIPKRVFVYVHYRKKLQEMFDT